MDKTEFIEKYKMRELSENDGLVLDIVYATANNFTNEVLYKEPICMLREKTAKKLLKANLKLNKLGFKIKIWDAFRPVKYQLKMWEIYPNEKFVSNPEKGNSIHCMGSAVDITLCDMNNNELKMPTKFDHFGIESYRDYYNNLDDITRNNVLLLENTMIECGFDLDPFEWWHFNDKDNYDMIYEMFE